MSDKIITFAHHDGKIPIDCNEFLDTFNEKRNFLKNLPEFNLETVLKFYRFDKIDKNKIREFETVTGIKLDNEIDLLSFNETFYILAEFHGFIDHKGHCLKKAL